jgi:hypothetical protein
MMDGTTRVVKHRHGIASINVRQSIGSGQTITSIQEMTKELALGRNLKLSLRFQIMPQSLPSRLATINMPLVNQMARQTQWLLRLDLRNSFNLFHLVRMA